MRGRVSHVEEVTYRERSGCRRKIDMGDIARVMVGGSERKRKRGEKDGEAERERKEREK